MGFDLQLRNTTMKPVNNHRITFLSNGLLFTSALLFAAFNYSEKDTINKELDRVESTLVKYETQVKEKPKKIIKIYFSGRNLEKVLDFMIFFSKFW